MNLHQLKLLVDAAVEGATEGMPEVYNETPRGDGPCSVLDVRVSPTAFVIRGRND